MVLSVLDICFVTLLCHHPGDWLMASLNDYLLASNVAMEVLHSPDGGQKGFSRSENVSPTLLKGWLA